MRKILYIILDGLGDRPCKSLANRTPLEAANIPHLNNLAKKAKLGLMYSVGKDIAPESDIAVISLLGYDAEKYYTGRGPLESFAEGLDIKNGDLAYRVNFATCDEERRIIDRRVGRNLTSEEAALLCEEMNSCIRLKGADFKFKNTIGHRGVLVIKSVNGKLSGMVTNTDPAYERKGVFGIAKDSFENFVIDAMPMAGYNNVEGAKESARLTNEFVRLSHDVLEKSSINKKRKKEGKLPANIILTRDGGDRLPCFPNICEQYNLRFGSFVEMPVERGIALLTGMEVVELPLSAGDLKKDYSIRANKVIESIKDFDCLYIHIKGPDEPAHDGDAVMKRSSIEMIDEYFFKTLLASINMDDFIICVTADHSTPCELKSHSDDAVPVLITGASIEPDRMDSFSEKTSGMGRLGTIMGKELLPLLISYQ